MSDEPTINEADLRGTADAAVWAQAFVERFGTETIDLGLMVGWFANAIEVGKMTAYQAGYADGQRETSHALMGLDDRPSS